MSLPKRVEQYLAERRRLGFELHSKGQSLGRFARYVEAVGHRGPLTVESMASWARQVKKGQGDRGTAARALRALRPFMRWLEQFEPATEVPDEAIFGPVPGRLTPHIFRGAEIEALLEAAGRIRPRLRSALMQTLFGLIACTGLRISEALGLTDADVDLKVGVLSVRCSKFGKSRQVPLHPSALAALCAYRRERAKYVPADPEGPFFIATRGRRLGRALSDRQVQRIFEQLRRQLGWASRGVREFCGVLRARVFIRCTGAAMVWATRTDLPAGALPKLRSVCGIRGVCSWQSSPDKDRHADLVCVCDF
jgi:site-specific recombinase XerD